MKEPMGGTLESEVQVGMTLRIRIEVPAAKVRLPVFNRPDLTEGS